MGILLVGSLLKDTFPAWNVDVIDGELYSSLELEQRILGSDVLGLSANTNNYQSCLELAQFAKRHDVKRVVIGGPHASVVLPLNPPIPMAELILHHQQTIDAVTVYDGENAFLQYLAQIAKRQPHFGGIPNLWFRDTNGSIQHGDIILPIKPPRFTDMNFSLIDLTPYRQEHKKEFPAMSEKFVEGFTHVGCAWREKLGCSFCDIPYPFNNYQAPGRFWRDVRESRRQLMVDAVKDYGDCLTGNPERVKALLAARPLDLEDLALSCYGRSSEITEDMADLLNQLHVKYLYIGFDAGDATMLKNMQEGYSPKANYAALERLERRGIYVTGSLILGAPGESRETIGHTEKFAREALHYSNLAQLHCAILTPFPSAPLAKVFLERNPDFSQQDIWDSEITTKRWISSFCEVPHEYIEEKAREINSLNPSSRKRYFGLQRPQD